MLEMSFNTLVMFLVHLEPSLQKIPKQKLRWNDHYLTKDLSRNVGSPLLPASDPMGTKTNIPLTFSPVRKRNKSWKMFFCGSMGD